MEPDALHEPRAPRRPLATSTSGIARPIAEGRPARPRRCGSASVRSCCAASSTTSRPSCRRAPTWSLRVELDDGERAVYDAVRAAAQKDVVAMLCQGGKGVLAGARGAAAPAPGRLSPRARARPERADARRRSRRCCEALETAVAEGHKALVFSQWTASSIWSSRASRRAELPFARLDGSTRDRGDVVARFQAPDGPPVLLVSLKAGGTGLNLTAADHVFLSTRGGTRPSRSRPPIAPTASARTARSSSTAWSPRTRSRSGSSPFRTANAPSWTPRSATAPPPPPSPATTS